MSDVVEVERHGAVALIRMNDPARLNALSAAMADALRGAVADLARSSRAIILTGAGRAFSAGGSLDGPLANPSGDADFGAILETHVNPLMLELRDLPIPWITAVRGAAAGVGCSLALAADMIVAARDAYFLQAFSLIGLVPDGGSTHLLTRTVGRSRAMEMALLGERLPAERALAWGLVNRVVADEALEAEALALAQRLAKGPASLGRTRRLIWEAVDAPFEQSLRREREEQAAAGRSADAAEGVVAFLAKRKPGFTGA